MNIYEYINSRDIAEHCRSINHQFTPIEMAVLINSSRKTVTEKHDAYTWIIENTPDCQVPKRPMCNYHASLHEFLQQLMRVENKIYDLFKKQESDFCYALDIDESSFAKHSGIYLSREKAMRYALDDEDMVAFSITKKQFDDAESSAAIMCRYNKNGDLLNCSGWGEIIPEAEHSVTSDLDGIYIDLPVPFKMGDLVTLRDSNDAFVLSSIPQWNKNYETLSKWWDSSDITANGYCLCDYGGRYDAHLWRNSARGCVHLMLWDLEYYRGELKGLDRFLKCLSLYLKDEFPKENIYALLHAYDVVQKNKGNEDFKNYYEYGEDFFLIDKPGEEKNCD
jgi:hypothetical protein